MSKSSSIFGNEMSKKTVSSAYKSKQKYVKKYGDDSQTDYILRFLPIDALSPLGAKNVVAVRAGLSDAFPKNALIVGNIRMGFGHYRISIAMASCAKALGYQPFWLDLAGQKTTGGAVIREQNNLYSLASRISQKSKLFNKFFWEPLNRDGFKKITYNAKDQANSELMTPIFAHIPPNTPYIATHVWPSQAAVHAGMTHVVNAIPDNWPMALHLSEGAIHAVQTPFAYLGYKMLDGFDKKPLQGIPEDQLKMVGHYVDHELLVDLKGDNERRRARLAKGEPVRILLTVGGAGAGQDMFLAMVKHLMPLVKQKKVALYLNFGDHTKVYQFLCKKIKGFGDMCTRYFDDYTAFTQKVADMKEGYADGITCIYNKDIFKAVYSTNLLMPVCDLMVTKPSELVFYPIPKVFQRHIGGHEVYGGIHGREIGDATYECETADQLNAMLTRLLEDKEILTHMTYQIDKLQEQGYYDGGYECVRLAVGKDRSGF